MSAEAQLITYIANGGTLGSPDNATSRYRAELMRLMAVLVDSEMAGASGFANCITMAPGLRERIIAAQMVVDKFNHASKVLELMEQFGAKLTPYVQAHPWAARQARDVNLGTRRVDGDMRLNVFHYPIEGWLDSVVMNLLMGRASVLQLGEFASCSYQPFADVIAQILPVEERHASLGEKGLKQALANGASIADAQASVDYWYPRVADSFGRAGSDHIDNYKKYGLRTQANESLLGAWQADVGQRLAALGLKAPARA